jgi:hypothetical protein
LAWLLVAELKSMMARYSRPMQDRRFDEFHARGRASLAKARKTGEFYLLQSTLDDMQKRLEQRMAEHRKKTRSSKA